MKIRLDVINQSVENKSQWISKIILQGGILLLLLSFIFFNFFVRIFPVVILFSFLCILIGYVLTNKPNYKRVGKIVISTDYIEIISPDLIVLLKDEIKELIYYKGNHIFEHYNGSIIGYLNEGLNDYLFIITEKEKRFINIHVKKQKYYNQIKRIIYNANYLAKFEIIKDMNSFSRIIIEQDLEEIIGLSEKSKFNMCKNDLKH